MSDMYVEWGTQYLIGKNGRCKDVYDFMIKFLSYKEDVISDYSHSFFNKSIHIDFEYMNWKFSIHNEYNQILISVYKNLQEYMFTIKGSELNEAKNAYSSLFKDAGFGPYDLETFVNYYHNSADGSITTISLFT